MASLHFTGGQFLDNVHDLTFTITEGTRAESGQLRLPLHSLTSDQYITSSIGNTALEVRLGTETQIPLKVENRLKEMGVVIESIELTNSQPDFWSSPPISLTPNITLPEMGTVTLDGLRVRPNAARVIPNTFLKLKNDADTQLKVNIKYAAAAGGKPKNLPIEINVRFVPTLFYLFAAILGGALFGATISLISAKHRTSVHAWLVACFTAALSAILLELLGIVLMSLNSEFKLFGITLDPFQFPQVLLMAALVGVLGPNIYDVIGPMVGRGGPSQPKRSEATAPGGPE